MSFDTVIAVSLVFALLYVLRVITDISSSLAKISGQIERVEQELQKIESNTYKASDYLYEGTEQYRRRRAEIN